MSKRIWSQHRPCCCLLQLWDWPGHWVVGYLLFPADFSIISISLIIPWFSPCSARSRCTGRWPGSWWRPRVRTWRWCAGACLRTEIIWTMKRGCDNKSQISHCSSGQACSHWGAAHGRSRCVHSDSRGEEARTRPGSWCRNLLLICTKLTQSDWNPSKPPREATCSRAEMVKQIYKNPKI